MLRIFARNGLDVKHLSFLCVSSLPLVVHWVLPVALTTANAKAVRPRIAGLTVRAEVFLEIPSGNSRSAQVAFPVRQIVTSNS